MAGIDIGRDSNIYSLSVCQVAHVDNKHHSQVEPKGDGEG
jgi:hypothetical protein